MRRYFVCLAFCLPCVLSLASVAQEQADPPQNPTRTGADVPSDVKQPPPPHKPFDFTVYGRVNVSFDVGDQGLNHYSCPNANSCGAVGATPTGQLRWLPDVASNLSRFGVRGYHDLAGADYQAVFQLEAQVDVAATPGSKPNGSNDTINPGNSAVTGALASRNSFIGIKTPFGALKFGKNDTPYKTVTADFDPLADTPADYNSIMGNTGGDNRTEFDARFPHALWYESPNIYGAHVNVIWSPGQNRFEDNIGYAIGENVCAGGNAGPCSDGSFGDGYGFSVDWHGYGLKLILAYEMHRKTNRTGDSGADTVGAGVATDTSVVGVADEYAWKFGAKYTFDQTGTTVAGIFEEMRRNDISTFNERQRDGLYFSAVQKLGQDDELMGGWAHAFQTPGDPTVGAMGITSAANNTVAGPGVSMENSADLLGAGYRHRFNPKTTVYAAYAHVSNGRFAHYAAGPGGHGVTWDCKDGSGPTTSSPGPGTGFVGNGTGCFTGTSPQAFTLGMTYDF